MDALSLLLLALPPPEMNFESSVNDVAGEIARRYFHDFRCIVHIADDWTQGSSWGVESSVRVINLNATFATNALESAYEADCRGFVLRVRDRSAIVEDLVSAYKKSDLNRYNNRRYLFLPRTEDDADESFLDANAMYFMPDVAFVAPRKNATEFDIVTHTYFDGHRYDVVGEKREVLDTWRRGEGFERKADLYPNKMLNLRGKRIVLAMMHYSPYALVMEEDNRTVFDGVETRIAALYAELRNATWIGLDHPVHLWGDIFDNGTGNGAIGSVYEHKADIGFSAIYQWHCDVLECSYPYIYAGVTCLAPKPLPLSGWYTIILPFESGVWFFILFSYLASSVFVFVLSALLYRIHHNGRFIPAPVKFLLECFFSTFRVQLEQSSHHSHGDSSLSVFFKIWTAYCFFVAVSWQSGIASFLTVPRYETPIDDAHDLTSRWPGIEWGGNHIDWTKSIEQTSEPELLKIVRYFRVLDDDELRRRVKTRDFGFFMERLPNGHYGLNDYIDEDAMKHLRIMNKNLYTGNCVMILPKCSPYLESLDKVLLWIFDTGLVQKLEIQISLERINNRLQNMIRASSEIGGDHEDMALLVTHIQGAIYIYVFGMMLSVVFFVGEIAQWRKLNQKKLERIHVA